MNLSYMEILTQCFGQVSKIEHKSQDQENASLYHPAKSLALCSQDHSSVIDMKSCNRLCIEQDKVVEKTSDWEHKEEGDYSGKERRNGGAVNTAESTGERKKKCKKAKGVRSLLTRGSNSTDTDRNANIFYSGENAMRKKHQKDTEPKPPVNLTTQPHRTGSMY